MRELGAPVPEEEGYSPSRAPEGEGEPQDGGNEPGEGMNDQMPVEDDGGPNEEEEEDDGDVRPIAMRRSAPVDMTRNVRARTASTVEHRRSTWKDRKSVV